MANAQHDLKTSLQYRAGLEVHDQQRLDSEQQLVETFRARAARFLGNLDRVYLRVPPAGNCQFHLEQNALVWDDPTIWGALAVARHYGVPTRLLDWTRNISVAAFFAACREPDADGAVWWFSQPEFHKAVHEQWDGWGVPPNPETQQRSMEQKAFAVDAAPWISNIYYPLPFPRLEKQAGFFTACGRLDMVHNTAIDDLAEVRITRGIVIVRREIKEQLLDHLESIGLRASTIDYPGADVEAAAVLGER
ncbi:MAG: FRG domain-containing protein [Planctomycetia bacterium]|nr:FRG domain-containing protein [Planctomycetia bacterium]